MKKFLGSKLVEELIFIHFDYTMNSNGQKLLGKTLQKGT